MAWTWWGYRREAAVGEGVPEQETRMQESRGSLETIDWAGKIEDELSNWMWKQRKEKGDGRGENGML